jgi:hypothetical protein
VYIDFTWLVLVKKQGVAEPGRLKEKMPLPTLLSGL